MKILEKNLICMTSTDCCCLSWWITIKKTESQFDKTGLFHFKKDAISDYATAPSCHREKESIGQWAWSHISSWMKLQSHSWRSANVGLLAKLSAKCQPKPSTSIKERRGKRERERWNMWFLRWIVFGQHHEEWCQTNSVPSLFSELYEMPNSDGSVLLHVWPAWRFRRWWIITARPSVGNVYFENGPRWL